MWFLVFIRRNGKSYHFKETSKMNRILYVCTFFFLYILYSSYPCYSISMSLFAIVFVKLNVY